jgi:hypothetical protein
MNFYKDNNEKVFSFREKSKRDIIAKNTLISISEAEKSTILEKKKSILTPAEIRDAAWLAQTYEVREGVVVTVRPEMVGKYDESIMRNLLFNIQNGLSAVEYVTDINGTPQPMNEVELIKTLVDGIRQTKENYSIWEKANVEAGQ